MAFKIISLAAALVLSTSTQAALIDRGNGMIYDEDLNITWLADANYVASNGSARFDKDGDALMDWSSAMGWADALRYGGFDDWRLPTGDLSCSGSIVETCTGGELGHLFYNELGGTTNSSIFNSTDSDLNLFSNIQPEAGSAFITYYWTSSEIFDGLFGIEQQAFTFNGGTVQGFDATFNHAVWAVRDGDVAAVPTPAAVWLFGSGLIGLIGLFKQRKHKGE